jgi:hypothetical protein
MSTRLFTSIHGIYFLLLLLSTIGCGPTAVRAPASDVDAAKLLLENSLDQWKSGKTFGELNSSTPPVYFQDESFRTGTKLRGYRILSAGEMYVTNVKFEVELEFDGAENEESRKRKLEYLVTTVPAQTIARLE